jgi:hypothetical protein
MITMDKTKEDKNIFESKSEERMKVRRPRMRWQEEVESDLREPKLGAKILRGLLRQRVNK